MTTIHKRLSTADEMADLLSTSRRMIYYFVTKGMPYKRFSEKVIRFDADEVIKWAEKQANRDTGPRSV